MTKLTQTSFRIAKYVIPFAGLIPLAFGVSVGLERLAPEKAEAALSSAAPAAIPEGSGTRVALIIGNSEYPDANTPLRHPVRDAQALAEQLRRNGFEVDVRSNLGKDEMKQAFASFKARIKPGAVALVSFGGYGIEIGRQSYMIPVNAKIWKETDVRRDGVAIESVLADMQKSGASVKLAIFDASRRNPFERRFRDVSSGLGAIDAPAGTLLLSAAATGKVAYDSDGEHSLLFGELLKEINAPGINAETVFNHTRIGVSRASNGEQVPLVSSSLIDNFAFTAGTPRQVSRPTASLAPRPARRETAEALTAPSSDAAATASAGAEPQYELASRSSETPPVQPKAVEQKAPETKPVAQKPAPPKPTEPKAAPVKENRAKVVDEVKRPRRTLREMSRDIEDEPSQPIRRGWWQSEAQREHRMEMQHERRMQTMERTMHRRMFGSIGF
jgi:uncharacterized caspase-like protein